MLVTKKLIPNAPTLLPLIEAKKQFIRKAEAILKDEKTLRNALKTQRADDFRDNNVNIADFMKIVNAQYRSAISVKRYTEALKNANATLDRLRTSAAKSKTVTVKSLSIRANGSTIEPTRGVSPGELNNYQWEASSRFEPWSAFGPPGAREMQPYLTDGCVRLRCGSVVSNRIKIAPVIRREAALAKRASYRFDDADDVFIARCSSVASRILRALQPKVSRGSDYDEISGARFSTRVFHDRVMQLPERFQMSAGDIALLCENPADPKLVELVEFCEPTIRLNPNAMRTRLREIHDGATIRLKLTNAAPMSSVLDADDGFSVATPSAPAMTEAQARRQALRTWAKDYGKKYGVNGNSPSNVIEKAQERAERAKLAAVEKAQADAEAEKLAAEEAAKAEAEAAKKASEEAAEAEAEALKRAAELAEAERAAREAEIEAAAAAVKAEKEREEAEALAKADADAAAVRKAAEEAAEAEAAALKRTEELAEAEREKKAAAQAEAEAAAQAEAARVEAEAAAQAEEEAVAQAKVAAQGVKTRGQLERDAMVREYARAVFEAWDTDESEGLNREEIRTALVAYKKQPGLTFEILDVFDENNDQVLSFDEFMDWVLRTKADKEITPEAWRTMREIIKNTRSKRLINDAVVKALANVKKARFMPEDPDIERMAIGFAPKAGELSQMMNEMSDEVASDDDELQFAVDSEVETEDEAVHSEQFEFAESSAAETDSDLDFAESSTIEKTDSNLEFAESSAVEKMSATGTDSELEFAESSAVEKSSVGHTSDLDFAESSAVDTEDDVATMNAMKSTSSGLEFAESSAVESDSGVEHN